MEKYSSGSRGSPAKGLGWIKPVRGFESLLLRHRKPWNRQVSRLFFFASCKRFRRRKTPWRKRGGTKERHLLLADVSLSWQGGTIQILSGRSNSLAFKFAIFLEKHPTGLLAGGAFAPYKRFRRKRKPWRRADSRSCQDFFAL